MQAPLGYLMSDSDTTHVPDDAGRAAQCPGLSYIEMARLKGLRSSANRLRCVLPNCTAASLGNTHSFAAERLIRAILRTESAPSPPVAGFVMFLHRASEHHRVNGSSLSLNIGRISGATAINVIPACRMH